MMDYMFNAGVEKKYEGNEFDNYNCNARLNGILNARYDIFGDKTIEVPREDIIVTKSSNNSRDFEKQCDELKRRYSEFIHDDVPSSVLKAAIAGLRNLVNKELPALMAVERQSGKIDYRSRDRIIMGERNTINTLNKIREMVNKYGKK